MKTEMKTVDTADHVSYLRQTSHTTARRQMTAEPGCPVTELLLDWGNGDREALKEVFSLVYYELQRLARHQLRHQRPNHTLQTTVEVTG